MRIPIMDNTILWWEQHVSYYTWIMKIICRLCYTGHTKNITSIMVYRKYSSFNTNNWISFNNVYTTLVNKYRTIYWVLMTIPRALGFVWGWGRLSSYYSEILSMNQNECLWKMRRFLYVKDHFYRILEKRKRTVFHITCFIFHQYSTLSQVARLSNSSLIPYYCMKNLQLCVKQWTIKQSINQSIRSV